MRKWLVTLDVNSGLPDESPVCVFVSIHSDPTSVVWPFVQYILQRQSSPFKLCAVKRTLMALLCAYFPASRGKLQRQDAAVKNWDPITNCDEPGMRTGWLFSSFFNTADMWINNTYLFKALVQQFCSSGQQRAQIPLGLILAQWQYKFHCLFTGLDSSSLVSRDQSLYDIWICFEHINQQDCDALFCDSIW